MPGTNSSWMEGGGEKWILVSRLTGSPGQGPCPQQPQAQHTGGTFCKSGPRRKCACSSQSPGLTTTRWTERAGTGLGIALPGLPNRMKQGVECHRSISGTLSCHFPWSRQPCVREQGHSWGIAAHPAVVHQVLNQENPLREMQDPVCL